MATLPTVDARQSDMARDVEPTLAEIALEAAGGDRDSAVKRMVEMMTASPDYVRLNFERILHAWARDEIGAVYASARKRIGRSLDAVRTAPLASFSETLRHSMLMERARLMDDPVWGGKRLGDCTIAEVRQSAAEYQTVADSNGARARFHRMVAVEAEKNAIGGVGIIREILTENALVRIREETNA